MCPGTARCAAKRQTVDGGGHQFPQQLLSIRGVDGGGVCTYASDRQCRLYVAAVGSVLCPLRHSSRRLSRSICSCAIVAIDLHLSRLYASTTETCYLYAIAFRTLAIRMRNARKGTVSIPTLNAIQRSSLSKRTFGGPAPPSCTA